jgi:cytochrome c peroxidase
VNPRVILALVALASTAQAQQIDLQRRAKALFDPIPTQPPALASNPVTPAKIELGKMLYFDPRLSSSRLISCNTCHNVGLAGADLQETSIGHGWRRGPRNAPTVFNAVFNVAQFWDGRASDLKQQAKGPVVAAVEMNNSADSVVAALRAIPGYVDAFGKAFPGVSDPVSFENMARAIEAFEATLLTPGSRFDRYLAGDTRALTESERRGLTAFLDEGCVACHSGRNLGGTGYYVFGVVERPGAAILPPKDKGRFAVTRTATDEYVFKSPSLRNVALTAPYFHSGVVWDLEQAVAVMSSAQLGIELSAEEIGAIVDFLRALTGEQPKIEYPVLPPSTAGSPHRP